MPAKLKNILIDTLPPIFMAGLITGFFIYFLFQPAIANFILGFLIGIQSYLYISGFQTFIKPVLDKRNFFLALTGSTLANIVLIILAVFISLIVINNFNPVTVIKNFEQILFSQAMLYGIVFGLVLSFLFSSYAMFDMLLGKNFLLKLFTGKYHTPFEEERVFMFLDLRSSTTLAEKLGHKAFLQMLNDFYYDVALAVSQTKGEIYKYVGDEAIITWKMNRTKNSTAPVDCFFLIKQQIEKNRMKYEKRYATIPRFKAGIHGGTVVTGELGHVRKEIAFLGDVLNTTARIEALCNPLNQSLIVSDSVISVMGLDGKYTTETLGERPLRGKQKPVGISTVHPVK